MTYIFGFKDRGVVYLVADTAVTVFGLQHGLTSHSSFGEMHLAGSERSVHEGALKILNLGTAAIAISGDMAVASSIARSLQEFIPLSESPYVALCRAIDNNGPYVPERGVGLLVATQSTEEAELMRFNSSEGVPEIVGEGALVPFGSIGAQHAYITASHIKLILDNAKAPKPIELLTAILAIVQSYGLHEYLIDRGVGGAFCGLFVAKDAITWQKDTLFLMYDEASKDHTLNFSLEGAVLTMVRDNALAVGSSHASPSFIDGIATPNISGWLRKWSDRVFLALSEGKYDYVVLLHRLYPIVIVIEMLQVIRIPDFHLHVRRTRGPDQNRDHRIHMEVGNTERLARAALTPAALAPDGTRGLKFNFIKQPQGWRDPARRARKRRRS